MGEKEMSEYEEILFKLLFEVGQAVDSVDQHIEVEQDRMSSEALAAVEGLTGKWWVGIEELHASLHKRFGIPMHIEYCAEHPDVKIFLRED